ncbi:MAG TPA: hypothetical protein VFE63_11805 [Roseiarcus sp.]|nr:hypothetical protein [Roseiarcus sp.]
MGRWRSAGVGDWHGGNWHGGAWRWRPGYWRHGYWHGGWWGPAFVAGTAVGDVGTYPYYDSCWVYEPLYDAYGNYPGQQYVNVCAP